MSIGILRYKGCEMPHNPEKLVLTKRKTDDGSIAEISGEGEFYGEDAVFQAKELKRLYTSGGSGALCVPTSGAYRAEMTKLEFTLTSVPDLIRYVFSFKVQNEEAVLYNLY